MNPEQYLKALSVYGLVEIQFLFDASWYVRVHIDQEVDTPWMIDQSLEAALLGMHRYCVAVYGEEL